MNTRIHQGIPISVCHCCYIKSQTGWWQRGRMVSRGGIDVTLPEFPSTVFIDHECQMSTQPQPTMPQTSANQLKVNIPEMSRIYNQYFHYSNRAVYDAAICENAESQESDVSLQFNKIFLNSTPTNTRTNEYLFIFCCPHHIPSYQLLIPSARPTSKDMKCKILHQHCYRSVIDIHCLVSLELNIDGSCTSPGPEWAEIITFLILAVSARTATRVEILYSEASLNF